MRHICEEVGLPVDPEEEEGPATTISLLGTELDTVALEICLPAEKLECLRTELGVLFHTCKAVRARRFFLQRLIDLSTVAKHHDHLAETIGPI